LQLTHPTEDIVPADLIRGLYENNSLLNQKNKEYIELSKKKYEAERAYRVCVHEQTLRYKMEGHPITIIKRLVDGEKAVVNTKFNFDVATEIHKACLESIKDIRTHIDTYRSLLTWVRAEMQGG
jgi:hypothetical protein